MFTGNHSEVEDGSQLQEIIFGIEMPGSQNQKKPESKFQRDTRIVFQTFCDQTSLHGLQYIGAKGNFWFRFFWVIIFTVAFSAGCYFISKVYNKWEESPVMVTFESKPREVDSIVFPAITICPGNVFLAKDAREILDKKHPDYEQRKKLVGAYCAGNNYYDNKGILASKLTLSCEDLMNSARYPSGTGMPFRVHKYVQNMSTFLHTPTRSSLFHCCTFNGIKPHSMYRNLNTTVQTSHTYNEEDDDDDEDDYNKILVNEEGLVKTLGIGVGNGFTYELGYFIECRSEEIEFQLSIHNPKEAPDLQADGLIIKPGSKLSYNVKPIIVDASTSLRDLKPKYRECYFSNEKYLRFYRYYTKRNCELDCLANKTLDSKCACVPNYLPAIKGLRTCSTRDEYTCYRGMLNEFERSMKPSCNCLQACEDITYVINTQYVPGGKTDEPKIMFDVFFTESIFFSYYRSELQGLSDFLASCGGLLGLFMGFSFISMIEVIYFLIVGVYKGITALR